MFGEFAEGVNGKLMTEYDDIIEISFKDCVRNYLNDKGGSTEKTIAAFKEKVEDSLGDLIKVD